MRKVKAYVHPQALESLRRFNSDIQAGHSSAAEYWRGQAGAYFTANPSFLDIAEKHFAKRPSVAHLVGKIYKMSDGTLWQLVAYNDLNIPYFSKVVGNKVGKKQFTIAFWSPDMKPIRNPILSTLGTYMLGGVGLYTGIQAAKWGHEKIKERVKITKNPENKQYYRPQIHQDPNLCHLHLRKKGPKIAECRICGRLFKWTDYGWKPIDSVRNPAKPHTEVVVSELPKCNFCTKNALFDGKTRSGPWAYMCFAHYAQYGVGLGLGKGQRLVLSKKNPTLKIPIKSDRQLEHLFRAQSQLAKAGVHFDSGTQLVSPQERHWELDYSLRGAKLENPIPRHCTPKQFGSETFYYAGKTMFRDKLDRAISDLKALGVKCKHSIRSKSYGYMLWTSRPTAVHFEMM